NIPDTLISPGTENGGRSGTLTPNPSPGGRGENRADPSPGGRGGTGGEIHVLELGIGVGLFARYFLDHQQELRRQDQKDYYQRLIYTAADRSERMLTDVLRHGVLAQHPGRYRVRQIDAMQPEMVARDVAFHPHPQPLSRGERGAPGSPLADNGTG